MFSNEAVDPRGNNGQRYRAELEVSIVERAELRLPYPDCKQATLQTSSKNDSRV